MARDYYCLVNFELKRFSKAHIHISDLGLQRGYGIFDFFRCRNGQLTWVNDYIDRIFSSAQKAKLELGFTKDELLAAILELKAANGLKDAYFKIIITGGYSDDFYTVTDHPNIIIINKPFKNLDQDIYRKGTNLISKKFKRSNFEIKSLNYFDSVAMQSERKKAKAIDVLYTGKYIYEASRSNIFFVQNKTLYTPISDILQGVTRKNLIKMFEKDYKIIIDKIPTKYLYDFDEVFLTGSGKDIVPIVSIDGKKIGNGKPGKITTKIIKKFNQRIFKEV